MRKTIVTGILAASLITAGGAGMYLTSASANENSVNLMEHHQGMDMDQMHDMMNSGNFEEMKELMESGNMNFGQMKPFMKEMHPELSNEQLLERYKEMHGTAGSANSHNFKGMMGK